MTPLEMARARMERIVTQLSSLPDLEDDAIRNELIRESESILKDLEEIAANG
jgi:hypothetical protein